MPQLPSTVTSVAACASALAWGAVGEYTLCLSSCSSTGAQVLFAFCVPLEGIPFQCSNRAFHHAWLRASQDSWHRESAL